MIPNQNDNFKKINEIYINDKKNKIPEVIAPIYKRIFKKEMKELYLNQNINIDIFAYRIKKKKF